MNHYDVLSNEGSLVAAPWLNVKPLHFHKWGLHANTWKTGHGKNGYSFVITKVKYGRNIRYVVCCEDINDRAVFRDEMSSRFQEGQRSLDSAKYYAECMAHGRGHRKSKLASVLAPAHISWGKSGVDKGMYVGSWSLSRDVYSENSIDLANTPDGWRVAFRRWSWVNSFDFDTDILKIITDKKFKTKTEASICAGLAVRNAYLMDKVSSMPNGQSVLRNMSTNLGLIPEDRIRYFKSIISAVVIAGLSGEQFEAQVYISAVEPCDGRNPDMEDCIDSAHRLLTAFSDVSK